MADEQRPAATTPSPKLPPLPRGPVSQGVERVSSDPNPAGGIGEGSPRSPSEKQGKGDNRREPGRGGSGEAKEPSPAGDRVVPAGGENRSAASIFASSDNVLKTIADRFILARDQQKAAAWRQLQRDLMDASPYICPVLIPYKDLIQLVADIEKELKGTTSQVGRSNEEILASFLSGEDTIPVPPVPKPMEELDSSDKMSES